MQRLEQGGAFYPPSSLGGETNSMLPFFKNISRFTFHARINFSLSLTRVLDDKKLKTVLPIVKMFLILLQSTLRKAFFLFVLT